MIEGRLQVPVNNISVMLGLFLEKGREKEDGVDYKALSPPPKIVLSEATFILPTSKIQCADPEGDRGSGGFPPPPGKLQKYRVL